MYSPVNGRVVAVNAGLGDQVKRGDALAVIESPDIGTAVSDERKANADFTAAEHEFKRKQQLFEGGASSAAELETAKDTYRKAKAELERAQRKTMLLHSGNVNAVTQRYTVTAPLDGEVLSRNVSVGVEVAGQYSQGNPVELFMLGAIDSVWVFADVYEVDMARVVVGASAHVSVIAYPDRVFDGRIDWVSSVLDSATRTVRARCVLDNHDRKLRPEMFATVSISVDVTKHLAVPASAGVQMGEQQIVFVEAGKTADQRTKFVRRPVAVERTTGGKWMRVEHGLERGERVVTSGADKLSTMAS